MRLQHFLNERNEYSDPSRMTSINRDEFVKLARTHCKDALKSYVVEGKNFIWRGDNNSGTFFKGDTSSSAPRVSRNTSNYYTLWFDNHPDWKDYPKRSKSFICTNDEVYAMVFGSSHKVILPYDGVKIGVCPRGDMWGSFPRVSYIGNGWDLADLNSYLNTLFKIIEGRSIGSYDKDWSTFSGIVKDIDKKYSWRDILIKLQSASDEHIHSAYTIDQLTSFIKHEVPKQGNLWNTIEWLLDPKVNEFKITTSKHIPVGETELWMEGPVLSISPRELGNDITIIDYLREVMN